MKVNDNIYRGTRKDFITWEEARRRLKAGRGTLQMRPQKPKAVADVTKEAGSDGILWKPPRKSRKCLDGAMALPGFYPTEIPVRVAKDVCARMMATARLVTLKSQNQLNLKSLWKGFSQLVQMKTSGCPPELFLRGSCLWRTGQQKTGG